MPKDSERKKAGKQTPEETTADRKTRAVKALKEPANLLDTVYKHADETYALYDVEIEFRDRCLGGRPKRLDVAQAALEAQARKCKMPPEVLERKLADLRELYLDAEKARENGDVSSPDHAVDGAKDAADSAWTTFYMDGTGIYLEQRVVKACLKDAMKQLGIFVAKKRGPGGTIGAAGTHNTGMFVEPGRIYFRRDGEILDRPDGSEAMPANVMTGQGPKAILNQVDYVDGGTRMKFTIKLVIGCGLDEGDLLRSLAIARDIGVGAKRSQSFGQFEIIKCERRGIGR
jgi:hypothetical protein